MFLPDDDRVSAYLDDELSSEERRGFEEELAASPELAAQVRSVGSLRSALRDLPEVEPPMDLVAEGRRRRRVARARRTTRPAMAIVAVAAAWFLVLGFGAGSALPRVVPALDDLVDAHAAAASGVPIGFAEMDMAMMGEDHPGTLGDGMELAAVFARGQLVLLSYSDGEHAVSVFEQPGVVDWKEMPDGGEMKPMADDSMSWTKAMEGTEVMVVSSGDTVLTVVADPGMGPMTDAVMSMADGDGDGPSITERLRRAAADVVGMFGLD
jgi:hypothetical protein